MTQKDLGLRIRAGIVLASDYDGNLSTQNSKEEIIMADVPGSWVITTDWGCDGSITGTFDQTFNADGSWASSPFVHSGRWYQVEGLVVWTFNDTANLVYAANLSGSWMAGVQGYETAGGIKGCFGAHRAGVAAAQIAAPAPGYDPALGR